MAGTPKTSQFTAATVANPTDEVPLLQGGVLKRVQVKTLVGNPDVGWLATGESWTYSSWDATRRIGVVNVPSDATTKYTAGNRVRISQTTGGTKYAIITYVTSTTLTLHFQSGITLNNEAISTPFYSPLDSPLGFNKDRSLWQIEVTQTTQQSQASPGSGTWYNTGSNSISLGAGIWDTYYEVLVETNRASGPAIDVLTTLSTSNSSESDKGFTAWSFLNGGAVTSWNTVHTHTRRKQIALTSNSQYYLNISCINGGMTSLDVRGNNGTTIINAISAYL